MSILKLPNVGDTHTMTITECVRATGTYGEQVKFTDGTDILFLPQSSADMQLKRIFGDAFAYTDAVGNTLTFSRSPNNKRPGAAPYWNIEPATPQAEAPSKRMAAPVASAPVAGNAEARRAAIADAYLALYHWVAASIEGTPDAVQAATATIWITWNQRGIQPDGATATPVAEEVPVVRHPAPSGKRLAPPLAVPDTLPHASKYDDDLPF
jgi:hypothetical protein